MADLIQQLVDKLDYASHLQRTLQDSDLRMENVKELITFATETLIDDLNKVDEQSTGSDPSPEDDSDLASTESV